MITEKGMQQIGQSILALFGKCQVTIDDGLINNTARRDEWAYGGSGGAGTKITGQYINTSTKQLAVAPFSTSGRQVGMQLSIDGVLFAKAEGGENGTDGVVKTSDSTPNSAGEYYRTITAVIHGSSGSAGKALLVPVGFTSSSNSSNEQVIITAVSMNAPPENVTTIQYGTAYAGQPIALTCSMTTDPEGDTITYIWEERHSGGVWSRMATSELPAFEATVPTEGTTIQYRVKASDSYGNESGYATGEIRQIDHNRPPVITALDADPVEHRAPETDYSVQDPDGDAISLAEWLNGKKLREIAQAIAQQIYEGRIPHRDYVSLPNGTHRFRIIATDDRGASASHEVSFERNETRIRVRFEHLLRRTTTGPSQSK